MTLLSRRHEDRWSALLGSLLALGLGSGCLSGGTLGRLALRLLHVRGPEGKVLSERSRGQRGSISRISQRFNVQIELTSRRSCMMSVESL